MTWNNIITAFNNIADNHLQINTFGYGEFPDIATSGDIVYPMMFVAPAEAQVRGKVLRLKFEMLFLDIPKKGDVDVVEIESDQLQIAQDVISLLQHQDYEWKFITDSLKLDRFRNRYDDDLSGWVLDVFLDVENGKDICAVPTSDSTPDSNPRCPSVTIYDTNGAVVATVAAGGSYTVSACASATVRNSDSTYSTTVASGGALVLPDITHIDSDGAGVSTPGEKVFTCTPQVKSTFLNFVFGIGATADYTETIVSGEEGTYTAETLTNFTSPVYRKNGSVVTLPFTIAAADTLRITGTITNTAAEARVKLTGTYT